MAVFRVERNRGYTVMSNHHLRNRDLTLKAKGLLSQMLSLPDNWDYTLAGLSRINRESIEAIRTAVCERIISSVPVVPVVVVQVCLQSLRSVKMDRMILYTSLILCQYLEVIPGGLGLISAARRSSSVILVWSHFNPI